MLFHTWTFLLFLAVVLPVLFALRTTRLWVPWLLIASYTFYGWWNPYYLILVFYSTLLDFILVALMDHCPMERKKFDWRTRLTRLHFDDAVMKAAFIITAVGTVVSIGMALTLRLRSGDVEPAPELPFDAARVVVGRAAGCDLQLPDPSVSLRHASLRQRGSEYVIVDEGSENGTFLRGKRLTKHAPQPLASGDLLRFGRVWVEVRLGPADHPIEVQASRELARRLVDAALVADDKPSGMSVSYEGTDLSITLAEPRRPYLVGSKKGADLRITDADLPSRCLELRRQADQLWVTLVGKADATLGERELCFGERTAWPKSAVLSIGELRLKVSDPTAGILEQLERGRTERLADAAAIDPPSGADDEDSADDEDDDASEEEDEAWDDPASAVGDEDVANARSQLAAGAPALAKTTRRGWSRTDAVVFFLAVGMLALSLWAIRWLAQLGSA